MATTLIFKEFRTTKTYFSSISLRETASTIWSNVSKLSVIMINGRITNSETIANIRASPQSIVCTKCFAEGGGCSGVNSECDCTQGYTGRLCNRKVIRMSSDTLDESRELK